MRDLIRTAEGVITRSEFRRGGFILLPLTLGVFGLLYGIAILSHKMEWMTVAVAPFFGMIVLFAVCSLVYFWFCLFIKRLRGMGQPTQFPYAWMGAIALAGIGFLLDYQNRTLGLANEGILVEARSIGVLFAFLAALFFFIQLGVCWLGPDRNVGTGQCFPDRKDLQS